MGSAVGSHDGEAPSEAAAVRPVERAVRCLLGHLRSAIEHRQDA